MKDKIMIKKVKKHKFKAKRCELDGIKFPSKLEARYYLKLKKDQQDGSVVFFLRQVPFYLPGGVKYVVDFQVFYSDDTVAFIDVKGMMTPTAKLKIKQVESLYPITIQIVKKF